ncbi:MAG: ABC transporter permease [Bacteroidota bacterium]|nr:ABC transporter permease [Bacteroidota bacterium]MDP3144941.1 ABC transporter permease [Bacteroidota bacterium]
MSIEKFIADRISNPKLDKGNISKPIVKIGIIGIALGVSVMFLTVSIVLGFKKEIVNRITGLTTDLVISNINVNSSNEPEPIYLNEDSLKKIKNLPFVKHLQTTAFKNGILKTETENEGIVLKGITENYNFDFIKKHLIEGRLPIFKKDEASKDIFISSSLAEKLNLKLDEKMLVYFISQHEVYDSTIKDFITKYEQRSRKFTICGVFKTSFSDFDKSLAFVDLKQIQRLNFWNENQVGNYEIRINDFEKLNENLETIQEFLGYNYNVNSVKELYSNIFIWLDKLDINGIIVIVLMIIVATINMITALLILILERTNMVGLVKALGMNNAQVRKIFLFISLKLVGKGLLWGNIIGITACLLQQYFKIIKLDSEIYYVEYVAIDINWLYFIGLNIGTFVACFVMLFLPTLILTKLTPIKTLKFD